VVLCADRAKKPKPYPDMLLTIAKRLKIDRADVLYVGDMTIDVKCAHAAGIRMAAVCTGSCSKKELKSLKPWAFMGTMVSLKPLITKEIK